jgi:prepilin-type N-terminal cleavage/methylation domain-containing protein/prepilin-type processing-associated H-X9-DG protein
MCRNLHPSARRRPRFHLRPRRADGVSAAFTLIELLVVIAVLGLLAAVLVPALRKGMDLAREGACKSNLRNWGIAFLAYAADHQGYLPHPDGRERSPQGTDNGEYGYMDMLPPYFGDRPWRDYPVGHKPVHGIWQCPGARVVPGANYSYSPEKDGYFSYAMNSYLAHDFPYGLPWNAELQSSFLFLGRCVAPPLTILMFEQTLDPEQGNGQSGGLGTAGRYGAEDARAATERHAHTFGGMGGNVLYLDGHVAWRNDLWDEKLKNPRMPKRGDLTWLPYPY